MNQRLCAWFVLWRSCKIRCLQRNGRIATWIFLGLCCHLGSVGVMGSSLCWANPGKDAVSVVGTTRIEAESHTDGQLGVTSWWQTGSYMTVGWFDTTKKPSHRVEEGEQGHLSGMVQRKQGTWLGSHTVAAKNPGASIDPSLPPPLSTVSVPPVEWPLVLLQGFSGMIVAGVTSFLLQTLVDLVVIGPLITAEDLEKSGIISTVVVLAVVPWLVAGTVYGLGQLSNNYRGSFWWALIGAYVGEGIAFGLGLLLNSIDTSDRKNISRLVRFLLDGLLIGVGSVLFYTLFRSSTGSFVRIGSLLQRQEGGRWAWGVPLPRVSQHENGETMVSFPVFSGRF